MSGQEITFDNQMRNGLRQHLRELFITFAYLTNSYMYKDLKVWAYFARENKDFVEK